MANKLEGLYVPKRGNVFAPYLIRNEKLRQLDVNKLSSTMVSGEERDSLRIPSTGDASLVVKYKERTGAVLSYTLLDQDLRVDQLQGAKQEGYRVNASLNWAFFFADEIFDLVAHPSSDVERLTMSPLILIQGLINASDEAAGRYYHFAARAGMRYSEAERLFARDVKS